MPVRRPLVDGAPRSIATGPLPGLRVGQRGIACDRWLRIHVSIAPRTKGAPATGATPHRAVRASPNPGANPIAMESLLVKPALAFVLAIVLASCSDRPGPMAGPAVAPSTPGTVESRGAKRTLRVSAVQAPSAPSNPAQSTPAAAERVLLVKQCGVSSISIIRHPDGSHGLLVRGDTGPARAVEDPPEMAGYSATGLGCARSTGMRDRGFVVEYGEEPYGCEFCEWRYLLDTQGNFLTHAVPPVLTDSTRPPGQQQYPNQHDYDEAAKRLRLVDDELDYIPAEQGGSP